MTITRKKKKKKTMAIIRRKKAHKKIRRISKGTLYQKILKDISGLKSSKDSILMTIQAAEDKGKLKPSQANLAREKVYSEDYNNRKSRGGRRAKKVEEDRWWE